jgi:hypothetical protein
VTPADLEVMSGRGGAAAWVAHHAREWLDYWREDIGTEGFYPFDLLAAGFVIQPEAFRCARVWTWLGKDDTLFVPFWKPTALMVGPEGAARVEDAMATGTAVYCPEVDSAVKEAWLR